MVDTSLEVQGKQQTQAPNGYIPAYTHDEIN